MIFDRDFNVIYVRVVQSCNLDCDHCFTNGNKDPFKLADLEDVKSYLLAIRENVGPKKAVFYIHGGETFLAPLNYLKEVNSLIRSIFNETDLIIVPQTNLLTNVDEDFLRFIKEEYDNEMGISWDYGIRFNESRRSLSEGRFFENFQKVIDSGINAAISITVQKHLLEKDPIELVRQFHGAKSIDFELLTIFDQKTQDLKVSNVQWAKYLKDIVEYYIANKTSWSLPQIDLFTKSIKENKLYRCKCDCCNNRTFTLNPNGTVGLCPDNAYFRPLGRSKEIQKDWSAFEQAAVLKISEREAMKVNPVCLSCEFYDFCGGNCEDSLFVEGEDECPLSKEVIRYQVENINLFKSKLDLAYANLPEL